MRTRREFDSQPFAGAVHAPGGQLLQATDLWVGVRFARIILLSNDHCRAPVVGAWLAKMGFTVGWYEGSHAQWQTEQPLQQVQRPQGLTSNLAELAAAEVAQGDLLILDARTSSAFQQGFYEGSHWVNRSSLPQRLAQLSSAQSVAVVADSAALAELVAIPLRDAGFEVSGWLPFSAQQTSLEVLRSKDLPPHHERIDYLYFVHDRHMGNLEAAKQYLAWELGLLEQLDAEERSTYQL